MQKVKEFVEYIVKQLVEYSDQVIISIRSEQDKEVLEIHVHEQDRGKVIGKQGQTIKAIRGLVNVIAPAGKIIAVDVVQ